jgi:hypothetical protein
MRVSLVENGQSLALTGGANAAILPLVHGLPLHP